MFFASLFCVYATMNVILCWQRSIVGAERSTPSSEMEFISAGENTTVKTNSGYKGWLSSLVSVTIISFISIVLIIPVVLCKKWRLYRYFMEILIGLAVGALLADSLSHIFPEMVRKAEHEHEIHDERGHAGHGHEDHAHAGHSHEDHDHAGHSHQPFYPSYVCIASMYLFYVFEYAVHRCFHEEERRNESDVVYNEAERVLMVEGNNEGRCRMNDHLELHKSHAGLPAATVVHINTSHEPSPVVDTTPNDARNIKEKFVDFIKRMKKEYHINRTVMLLTIGDLVHNCIDGLAIGSQFMKTWPGGYTAGVMTSIAILLHEVPHELGDNAAMIASGFSVKGTIAMNAFACVGGYLGVVIGCTLGNLTAGSIWVDALVAGMLLYIALSVLVPYMFSSLEKAEKPFLIMLCHTAGIALGVASIALVSVVENRFNITH